MRQMASIQVLFILDGVVALPAAQVSGVSENQGLPKMVGILMILGLLQLLLAVMVTANIYCVFTARQLF